MSKPVSRSPDLAIFASFSGEGGVEKMILNLINALAERGLQIDLLLIKTASKHLAAVHTAVNIIDLKSQHTLTSLLPLTHYLRKTRPPCLLAAKDRAGRTAVMARALSGSGNTRLLMRLGTNLTAALAHKSAWRMRLRRIPICLLYPYIDQIIAVSEGVKEDILNVSRVAADKVTVIRNPVITPQLEAAAEARPIPHPWLSDPQIPVILGAGRLTLQKDFQTLIQAFAKVRTERPCRLIILGDGRQKERLINLATSLNVETDLALPGFTANPYVYMRHAKLFVLSSRWEGSPNVLTEAMALGTPVVATDCPSGPNEILDEGRIAPLVPVGDHQRLAQAMLETLNHPPNPALLRHAVEAYRADISAAHYLKLTG
jgi:glycosyltransferase involved in cell wall biosynthesis